MSASHYYQKPFDNFIPVILSKDPQTHSLARPFCFTTPDCPCHEDTDEVNKVNEYVRDGLMTEAEAHNFVKGD
jgi:hypothetical protein